MFKLTSSLIIILSSLSFSCFASPYLGIGAGTFDGDESPAIFFGYQFEKGRAINVQLAKTVTADDADLGYIEVAGGRVVGDNTSLLINGYQYFDAGSQFIYPFVKVFVGANFLDVAYDGNLLGEVQVVDETVLMAGIAAGITVPLSQKFKLSVDGGYAAVDAFNPDSVPFTEGAIYTVGLSYTF